MSTLYTIILHDNLKTRLKQIITTHYPLKIISNIIKLLVLGVELTFYVKHETTSKICYTENEVITML